MCYEMFTEAGNNACQRLVNRLIKKIFSTKRVTADEIKEDVQVGMQKIAVKHGEVFDTEPDYIIKARVNKAMQTAGYQKISF